MKTIREVLEVIKININNFKTEFKCLYDNTIDTTPKIDD